MTQELGKEISLIMFLIMAGAGALWFVSIYIKEIYKMWSKRSYWDRWRGQ